MYVGKTTHRPLFSVSRLFHGFGSGVNVLHDTIVEENSEPVIMTNALEVGEVLVEVCSLRSNPLQIHVSITDNSQ